MNSIQTNRDLYLALADLIHQHQSSQRSLEHYLCALLQLACLHRDRSHLSLDEFFALLAGGFSREAMPFQNAWRARYDDDHRRLAGFAGFEARIIRQIVDLREMAEQRILEDEQRYFGINSPRGSRWYNFDPCTFLECATAGTYGGWEEGDDTGRDYVPGPVAVLDLEGHVVTIDPRDIVHPTEPISEVSWDDIRDFLGQGQWYE